MIIERTLEYQSLKEIADRRLKLLERCNSWLGVAYLHVKEFDDLTSSLKELTEAIENEIQND